MIYAAVTGLLLSAILQYYICIGYCAVVSYALLQFYLLELWLLLALYNPSPISLFNECSILLIIVTQ